MNTWTCGECRSLNRRPLSKSVKTLTCVGCGDVCFVTDGEIRRAYPALHMQGFEKPHEHGPDYPPSPWRSGTTRPPRAGIYEIRVRDFGDDIFRLHWNGVRWFTNCGPTVVRNLTAWRGVLA